MTNIRQPAGKFCSKWPECSFFGLFEGYEGVTCVDFLKDHLVWFIMRNRYFPNNPGEAMINGFYNAEAHFQKIVGKHQGPRIRPLEISGSCATIILIVDDVCYAAQLGESPIVLSVNGG